MKARYLVALAGAGAALALPSHALQYDRYSESRVAYPDRLAIDSGTIHAGAGSIADQALADQVAAALKADRRLAGATVTVVANGGDVMLSGSASDFTQAAHVEKTASDLAGRAHVSGTLDVQGS